MSQGRRGIFVTIATPDRAAQSRAFARSARKCYPDAKLVMLALNPDAAPAVFDDLYDLVVSAEELSLGNLADLRFRYSIAELCFALKPRIIEHLFDKFPDEPVFYFDSDIELFSPLAEAEAALADGAGLVMTPHILEPAPDQASEEDLLRSGTFNGGFLAVAPNPQGRGFVSWWGERLKTGCTLEATCGDQRWLDLAPSVCNDVTILRHPGYNFAWWNARERPLRCEEGSWTIAGQPLRFVHYTKWNLREQNSAQYLATYFRCEYRPFAALFTEYQRKVMEEDWSTREHSEKAAGEGPAPSGAPVPDLVRDAYARHAPAVDGDASEVFARAVSVLNAPSKLRADLPELPLSILYDEIWQRYGDLRYRFEVDQRAGRLAYLRWLAESGLAGLGIAAEFAAPARSALGLPLTEEDSASVEWLPLMKVGPAGERSQEGVSAVPGQAGHLVYGPYVKLAAGHYRVRVCWQAGRPLRAIPRDELVATIEAVSNDGKAYLAQREIRVSDYAHREHQLSFRLLDRAPGGAPIEVRVWTGGAVPLTVSSVSVERVAAGAKT